jgi:hypothetical protein
VWDIFRKLKPSLRDRSVLLRLSGAAGGDFLFGSHAAPDCTIETDIFSFSLRASNRITAEYVQARACISGSPAVAGWFLRNMEVPY